MEEKKQPWCHGLTPFMNNLNRKASDPMYKEIKENGIQDTRSLDVVQLEVPTDLTPEQQEEILNEEY